MYSKPQLLEAVEQESKINGIKVFEDIKDKDGHNRFIEANITGNTITGITWEYCKWSLSGSHLMTVVSGTIDNATTVADGVLCEIDLPQWIKDKIFPIYSTIVVGKTISVFNADDGTSQTFSVFLRKLSNGKVQITNYSLTTTKERVFRIDFDLLIDND